MEAAGERKLLIGTGSDGLLLALEASTLSERAGAFAASKVSEQDVEGLTAAAS